MKRHSFFFALAINLLFSEAARTEVAVRHVTTSEIEFQALAQALGYSTVAEILTEKPYVPKDLLELFKFRFAEAEKEWLAQKKVGSTPAIDRFLDLTFEADWDANARAAFVRILLRKVAVDPSLENEMFARVFDLVGDENVDFTETPMLREKWHHFRETQAAAAVFPTALPTDVAAVLVNGRIIARRDLTNLALPKRAVRVTLISNTYQPFTIRLNGDETDWPSFSRTPWIEDDCRANAWKAGADRSEIDSAQIKPLGYAGCSFSSGKPDALLGAKPGHYSEGFGAKFGITRAPSTLPEPTETKNSTLLSNPWFWGAVGVVAVGAAIAFKSSDRETVRPTVQESW